MIESASQLDSLSIRPPSLPSWWTNLIPAQFWWHETSTWIQFRPFCEGKVLVALGASTLVPTYQRLVSCISGLTDEATARDHSVVVEHVDNLLFPELGRQSPASTTTQLPFRSNHTARAGGVSATLIRRADQSRTSPTLLLYSSPHPGPDRHWVVVWDDSFPNIPPPNFSDSASHVWWSSRWSGHYAKCDGPS